MTPETRIACTLAPDELSERLENARQLGERALVGLDVSERRAVLRFDGERGSVDALVALESRCCAFFTFDVTEAGEQIELEILTPEGGELPLRGLVAGVVAGWEGRN